jgi:hypothetical protein
MICKCKWSFFSCNLYLCQDHSVCKKILKLGRPRLHLGILFQIYELDNTRIHTHSFFLFFLSHGQSSLSLSYQFTHPLSLTQNPKNISQLSGKLYTSKSLGNKLTTVGFKMLQISLKLKVFYLIGFYATSFQRWLSAKWRNGWSGWTSS